MLWLDSFQKYYINSLEADLIHWLNHTRTHLMVIYSVVATGLDFGKKQRWVRCSLYPQRAKCGERERKREIEMITN